MTYFDKRYDWEWSLLEFFHENSNSFFNFIAFLISFFGSGQATVIIIGVIYYSIDKKLGERIAFICMSSMLLNGIIKNIVVAKRPFQFDGKNHLRVYNEGMDSATGTSFPSGHSQNTGSLFTAILLNTKKKWIKIVCLILIIAVPLSRIILGVHFPVDTIIGLALGVACAVFLNWLYPKVMNGKSNKLFVHLIVLIIIVPLLVFFIGDPLAHDFCSSFGLYCGFILGTMIEKHYINFTTDVPFLEKVIRLVVGVVLLGVVYFLGSLFFKSILSWDNNISTIIRYSFVSLTAFGLTPLLFKAISKFSASLGARK